MMFAAAGAIVVTGLALGGLQLRERARYPQVTVPDGSILLVEGFTSGPVQELRLEPEFWTVLKKVLPPRWHRVTGPPLLPRRVAEHQGQHALWLSRRDPASGKYLSLDHPFKVEAVTAGGILFEAAGSIGFGSGERASYAAILRVLDWRADTLRLRVSKGDWQSEFSIPNPKRGQRFESWEAQPLPRTNRVKGFDIVLRGLRAFGDTNQPFWMPQGEIERDGRWAGSWFTTHWTFEDPTGNSGWRGLPSSEPIWKVRLVASPSPQFPFSSDELFPIGRIEMPGPGEFRVLPGRSDWTNAGLHAVVLTGPGNFAFTDGRNTLAQRPGEGASGSSTFMGLGAGGWRFTSERLQPMLHVLLRSPRLGNRLMPGGKASVPFVLCARRPDGEPSVWSMPNSSVAGDGTETVLHLSFVLDPSETHRVFDASLAVAPTRVVESEWIIASPYRR